MTTAAAVKNEAPLVHLVPLDHIDPSPSNPRKTFTEIDELAEDFKVHGVLAPVLLRPLPGANDGYYELVFGERRWRAAKKAKLQEIPAFIRELSDQEALELQIVENAKRADIHPVEEAEAYRELHEKHGMSVEAIAAKVGKSKRVVYERMQLCALAAAVKQAALEGKLPASHAVLIARVPAQFQEEALKKILEGNGYNPGPMTHEQAQDFVLSTYTLGLADAQWDLKDEQLVPSAGSCAKCPKRTGNQPELFHDVAKKDTCTDPACFSAKKKAHVALTISKAQEAGKPVIASAAEAKKAEKSGEYIDIDKAEYIEGKGYTTYRKLLGKKAETTLAPAPEGVKELVRKEDLEKVLPKMKKAAANDEAWKKEQEKHRAEQQQRGAVVNAVMADLVGKLEKTRQLGKAAWFVVAEATFEQFVGYGDMPEEFVERRLGHPQRTSAHEKDEEELRAQLPKMNAEQLCAFVIDVLLMQSEEFHKFYRDEKGAIRDLNSILGVDEKKIAAHVKAELAAAGKPGHVPPEPGAETVVHTGLPPKKKAAKKAKAPSATKAKPSKKKGKKK